MGNSVPASESTAFQQSVYPTGQGVSYTISGQNLKEYGATVRTASWLNITGASGGTQLSSASCFALTIRSHSGNALMLVGGTGTNTPVSGSIGLHLFGGESYEARVNNPNTISLVATTSGQQVSLLMIDS